MKSEVHWQLPEDLKRYFGHLDVTSHTQCCNLERRVWVWTLFSMIDISTKEHRHGLIQERAMTKAPIRDAGAQHRRWGSNFCYVDGDSDVKLFGVSEKQDGIAFEQVWKTSEKCLRTVNYMLRTNNEGSIFLRAAEMQCGEEMISLDSHPITLAIAARLMWSERWTFPLGWILPVWSIWHVGKISQFYSRRRYLCRKMQHVF